MPVVETRNLFTNPGFEAGSGTVVVRRNGCKNPRPTVVPATGWSSSGGSAITAEGFSVTPTTATVAFIFSAATDLAITVGKVYAFRAKVTATLLNGATGPGGVYVRPHSSGGYYSPDGGLSVTPADDITRDVGFFWTATVALSANDLHMAVSTTAAIEANNFRLSMTDVLIEEVPLATAVVPPFFLPGVTSPDVDLTPAWTGTVGNSASVLNGTPVAGLAASVGCYAIRSSQWANDGAYSLRIIPNATILSNSVVYLRSLTSADANKTFTLVAKGRLVSPTAVDAVYARSFFLSTNVGNVQGPKIPNVPGPQELRWTFTVPAGTTSGFVRIYHGGLYGDADIWWDSVAIVEGVYAGPSFTGDTADAASADGSAWNDYSWVGVANASVSLWKQDIRLTPFADMAPVPRVLVDAATSLFPAGAVTISLTRTAEGRTFDVRGGQRLPAGSPAVVIDPEAPFGVVSSYTVLGHDAEGKVIGSWPVGTVTLIHAKTVIQQPLDARLAAVVDRLDGTAFELSRSTPGSPVYPQGHVLPGLVGLGPRRGLQGVPLNLVAESQAEADNLQATLGTYDEPQLPIWLVRTPPGKRMPRVFFCHVPELVELDTYGTTGSGFVHFQADVTEVRPPAAGISGAVLTYSDVAVFYATYSAAGAAYGTYSDIKRDTSLVGAADA